MNPTIDTIRNRRSIRKYKAKRVSKRQLKELVGIAEYAPSSHNRQPWSFVIVTGRKTIGSLSEDIRSWYDSLLKLGSPLSFIREVRKSADAMRKRVDSEKDLFFYNAPALMIIHAPKKRFFVKDCSCAAQNIMLAARSMGIGSCWIGFADIAFNGSRKIKKKLGVPSSHRVMATLALGYPERFPSRALPRRKAAVEWIK
ncbi:nitroreductase family protein [Candidatus Woesearchaeota archaeon]|nr:nitroreductase family protein [Candidatus Woesearchaeota archaeon]